ncbi:MAG TPA: nucleotidyltransferase domain-containing protein [Polyangia bacterium]|jgi:prevent-host-death family protein|nr:nucleotidyltransferase domain-containing protein [Polyangia bacterium]
MKTVQATDLRRNFFETLKRLSYERDPVLIERRGKTIAALVPPDLVDGPRLTPTRDRLALDPRALDEFCARHAVKTLYLFGSALTSAFDTHSDVDLIFEAEGTSPDYFEQMNMTDELQTIFGRPVDLVSRRAVEESGNQTRKRAILDGARVIFAR